ncbi:hypothetical protein [Mesorhizobium escarrei]|uniref:Uncharacterized protein n=1 Tax=Mesorhizobium escarrei TaxID=666018 RepID=A0ABN8KB29_9HYPH|nr:hypothetical protein [Mesorhizobium escarrei]CAH2407481.1 hypothetical protein MES5069_60111 [Mesorhizobium escarrei]
MNRTIVDALKVKLTAGEEALRETAERSIRRPTICSFVPGRRVLQLLHDEARQPFCRRLHWLAQNELLGWKPLQQNNKLFATRFEEAASEVARVIARPQQFARTRLVRKNVEMALPMEELLGRHLRRDDFTRRVGQDET